MAGKMEDCQVVEEGFEKLVYQPQPGEYFNPLNLGRIVVLDAGQRWCAVVLETVVEKGVVRRLAEVAENAGIIIRFIQFSNIEPHDSLAKAIAFLDFSNTSVTPEEALRLVRKQPFVRSARMITPNSQGVLFDSHFFPLVVGKRRAVIFRRRVYESLFKGVREKFGTAGEAMLYYQGYAIGQRTCQAHSEETGIEIPEKLVQFLNVYLRTMGWGIMDFKTLEVEKGEAEVRLYQSFECEAGKGSETPYGHFIRGVLAGFLSNIFEREVKAVETKCIARGDPYCEYIIKA